MPASRTGRHPLAATLALALLGVAAWHLWHAIPGLAAVDFYHLWGVPVAHHALGSDPYVARDAYAAHLNDVAGATSSSALRRVNEFRRTILPTGTPSFYALFAMLPRDFDHALALFAFAQFAAFTTAVTIVARTYGMPVAPSLALGVAAVFLYNPFQQDVFSGNVNSFQLLGVALLVWASVARERLPPALFRFAFPALLAALAVFKPNIVWILSLLAVHQAFVSVRREWAGALAAAAFGALAFAALGAVYFDGLATWRHWLQYVRGDNGGGVFFTVAQGNYSLVQMLAELSPKTGLAKAQFAFTVVALAPIALASVRGTGRARDKARAAFADARFIAACGAVLMLAASPLVWPHYQMFAILPFAWLVAGRAGVTGMVLAAVSGLALIAPALQAVEAANAVTARVLVMFAWLPLAGGLCIGAPRLRPISGDA